MQGIGAKSFKKKASGRPPSFATPAKESNANWLKNSAIDKKLRGMIVSGAASKNMDIREIRAFQASNQEFARFNEKVFQTHYKELLTELDGGGKKTAAKAEGYLGDEGMRDENYSVVDDLAVSTASEGGDNSRVGEVLTLFGEFDVTSAEFSDRRGYAVMLMPPPDIENIQVDVIDHGTKLKVTYDWPHKINNLDNILAASVSSSSSSSSSTSPLLSSFDRDPDRAGVIPCLKKALRNKKTEQGLAKEDVPTSEVTIKLPFEVLDGSTSRRQHFVDMSSPADCEESNWALIVQLYSTQKVIDAARLTMSKLTPPTKKQRTNA